MLRRGKLARSPVFLTQEGTPMSRPERFIHDEVHGISITVDTAYGGDVLLDPGAFTFDQWPEVLAKIERMMNSAAAQCEKFTEWYCAAIEIYGDDDLGNGQSDWFAVFALGHTPESAANVMREMKRLAGEPLAAQA